MAVETLAAYRAADKGYNLQPTILAVKGTDGELYIAEADPATGGLIVDFNTSGIATEATLADIETAVDGLETIGTATNTKLDTIISHVDGIEGAVDQIEGYVDQIEGYVDGIETAIAATNTLLTDKLSGSLVPVKYDNIACDYSGGTADVFTYKLVAATVRVVTVTYTDATKTVISTVAAV